MKHKSKILITLTGMILILSGYVTAGTVTVNDQLGRQVVLKENPKRIVALAPSITEIVFALGKGDCLKGVTMFSDFPPEAKKIFKVGSYVNLDLERIVSLKPDLCIAVKDGNPKDTVYRLEALGIPVYTVDPDGLESVMKAALEIGRLLGADKRAKEVVADMRSRVEKVKSAVSKIVYRPGVFFQIGISPIVSVGTDTYIHELIELAGGRNLAQGNAGYPRFSEEQVLVLSPEVFIITSMARGEIFENVKKAWSRWPDMPAVRNNRIILVDSNILDRPTPRMIDGLELLVKVIHPELFNNDVQEDVKQ